MKDPKSNDEETKSGRGLNNYFKAMLDAKRNNKEEFDMESKLSNK